MPPPPPPTQQNEELGVDYGSRAAEETIANLRARLSQTQEELSYHRKSAEVTNPTSESEGILEKLEHLMQHFVELSDASESIGGRKASQEGNLSILSHKQEEAEAIRKHRLTTIDTDRACVEKMMVDLYERVEKATQFVFSGQTFRSMLVWAADHETAGAEPAVALPPVRLTKPIYVVPPVHSVLGRQPEASFQHRSVVPRAIQQAKAPLGDGFESISQAMASRAAAAAAAGGTVLSLSTSASELERVLDKRPPRELAKLGSWQLDDASHSSEHLGIAQRTGNSGLPVRNNPAARLKNVRALRSKPMR
jgi:hypothetical protein